MIRLMEPVPHFCMPLRGKGLHPAPITMATSLPLSFVSPIQSPVASPLAGPTLRGGRGQLPGASRLFTTPGYESLGQESFIQRTQGERASCFPCCLCLFPRLLPHHPHQGRLLSPSSLNQTGSLTSCVGKRLSHLPGSVPLSAPLVPKEVDLFLRRGLV